MTTPLAVLLAAGQGTRMKSDLPKVLIPVNGRPMIEYVLDALEAAGVPRVVVVVGYRGELVRETLAGRPNIEFVEQTQRLGTGHAVKSALPQLEQHTGPVVILAGDSPLVQASSLKKLLEYFAREQPACLLGTLHKENPAGLGRIVRDEEHKFVGIVEDKDATDEQRKITEVNMSTYVFAGPELVPALHALKNDNRQQEYYLTDCPAILQAQGKRIEALPVLEDREALSINTPEELAIVEAALRQ